MIRLTSYQDTEIDPEETPTEFARQYGRSLPRTYRVVVEYECDDAGLSAVREFVRQEMEKSE